MKRFLIGAAALAGVMSIGTAASANPACPYGVCPTITIDDPTATPGQSLTVTLSSYQGGEPIQIDVSPEGDAPIIGSSFRMPRVVVGTVTADADGGASAVIEAPVTVGTYVVTGTGLDSGGQAQTEFVVSTGAPATTTGPGLPPTGSDSDQLVRTGAAVLALGVGLVGVAAIRRRRTAAA